MNREEPPDALTIVMHFFLLQTHFGISSLSHPVNALEVCGLLTPLHIVPEWLNSCNRLLIAHRNLG